MAGNIKKNADVHILGKTKIQTVPNAQGTVITYNQVTEEISTRTDAEIISDLGLATISNLSNYIPTTGTISGKEISGWLEFQASNYSTGLRKAAGIDGAIACEIVMFDDSGIVLNAETINSRSNLSVNPTFFNVYVNDTNTTEYKTLTFDLNGLYGTPFIPSTDDHFIQKGYLVDNYASISSLGNYMTLNTEQVTDARKGFSGALNNFFYGAAVETRGNGSSNTIYPSIGFHQPTLFGGTISMRDPNQFYFRNIDDSSFVYLGAAGYRKAGSDDNKVLLGGGGDKLISDFWNTGNFNPDTKVNKSGDTMTGGLIINTPDSIGSGNLGILPQNYKLFLSNGAPNYGTIFWTEGSGQGYVQQQRADGIATAYRLNLQPYGGELYYGNSEVATQAYVSTNYIPKTHPVYNITQNYIDGWETYLGYWDNRQISPSSTAPHKLQFGFTSWNNNNDDNYADYLHFGGYSDSSGRNQNLIMFFKNGFGIRQYQGSSQSVSPYSQYVDYWHSGNFNPDNKVNKSGDTMTGNLNALTISAQNASDKLIYDNIENYGSPLKINANASLGVYLQANGTDILYAGPSVIQAYKTLAVTGNITATGNISSNTLISPTLAGGSYIINANSTELYFGNSLVPNVFYQANTAHYFIVDGINVGSFNSGGLGINGALSLNGQDVATQPWVNANYTPISHVGSGGTAHANATTSTAGFMSSADKTKLDNINTSNFVTINTTQTVTGSKSFADGSQVQFLGGDSNHIISQRIPGGSGTIVSGHDYTHYDTRWRVGNVRGGSTNSTALGFFFSSDNGSTFSNRVSIDSGSGQINTAIHGDSSEWNDIYQNGLRKGNTGFEYLEDYREIDNNTFDANQPSVKKYILVFDSSSNGHVKISNMVNSQEYQIMNVSPLNSIEIEVDGYGVIDSIDPGKFYNYISHSGGHFSRLNADGTISVLI